jgi:hypothetical protein
MKTIETLGAQGDLLIKRVDGLPSGLVQESPKDNRYIAAHSETGHHHWVAGDVGAFYKDPEDPFVCYLRVDSEFADFVHARDFDTHETIRVKKGNYKLINQQEYGPEGWQRAAD